MKRIIDEVKGEVIKYNQKQKLDIHEKGNQTKLFQLKFKETDFKFGVDCGFIGEWNIDKAIRELEFLKKHITELKAKAQQKK